MKGKGISGSAWLLLFVAGLLLAFPQESSAAAREAITICLDLMVPSLFPFFVLSSLFVSTGLATQFGKLLERGMQPLFHLSGSCAAALVLGAIGGYPVGMRTAAQLCTTGQCSKEDAIRLSCFCNNCGPAFLLGVAGIGIFSSKELGFLLIATHLTAALCVGILLRLWRPEKQSVMEASTFKPNSKSLSAVFPDCVRDSFASTLNVCAFVIIFSVLVRLADCSGILTGVAQGLSVLIPNGSPSLLRSLLIGLVELSTGICTLKPLTASPMALPLAAFLLGWGGLSVHCQSMPFLHQCGLSLRPYLMGKLLQGLLAALFTAMFAPYVIPSEPALAMQELVLATPVPLLMRQEILALWGISACFFLLSAQKKTRKT